MGIDVLDVAGLQICRCQGLAHCRGLTVPGRIGLDDVVGIGRNARASQGAIDRGAAGLGMLKGLQHEDGRALTEDEAVAVHVPGTGCVFRVVIARRQCLHLGEGGQWQRMDDGFRTAGDDDVGASQADLVQPQGDGLRGGGTR